ncbi:MAG: AMIN domain-containing protein [Deltaproteobacteria bacterium]|nr:AMIN domain-containing protein [Deltaproteobacteria bacterium]
MNRLIYTVDTFICLLLILAGPSAWAGSLASLKKIDFSSERNRTRVVMRMSRRVDFEQGEVPKNEEPGEPRRLFIDIKQSHLSNPKGVTTPVEDKRLFRIRTGQFDYTTIRVVLDLKESVSSYKVFSLNSPFRIVVDLFSLQKTEQEKRNGSPELEEPGLVEDQVDDGGGPNIEELLTAGEGRADAGQAPDQSENSLLLPFKRIVIDPGHGGDQPGAIGKTGLMEKNVVLDVAKRFKKIANRAYPGMDVVLTRETDKTLSLDERSRIANKLSADLFISIHANAHPRRSRYGIETYYLNVTSDRYSNRLAQVENKTSGKSLSDLQFILADLTRMANIDESRELARYIQGGVVRKLSRGWDMVKDLGVKNALFYVLLGAKMPACLVEISFLSNPREEKRLKDPVYLNAIAEGILDGIEAFAANRKKARAVDAP